MASVVKVTGLNRLNVFDATALMPQARFVSRITYGSGAIITDAPIEVVNYDGEMLRKLGQSREIRLPRAVVRGGW